MLSHRRFSRPVLSTTQPSLRVKKQFSRQTRVLYYHAPGGLSTKRHQRNLKKIKNRACKPAKTVLFLVSCLEKLYIRVWRSLVSRLNGVQEASSSNLDTRTMQSVLIGSEYPVMDTLLFYFSQSSYCNLFRGVAECYAFSRFHDNVGLRDCRLLRNCTHNLRFV